MAAVHSRSLPLVILLALAGQSLVPAYSARAAESESREKVRVVLPAPGKATEAQRIYAAGSAVVNFEDLSRREALLGPRKGEIRAKVMEEVEEPEEPLSAFAPAPQLSGLRPGSAQSRLGIQVASPSPTSSFIGLDDIPMVDSLYIVIPPDCGGAVGPLKILSGLNNNYRVFNKADGSVVSTVGTATFWAPSGETALNGLTDPRTLYDPYNNRWIAVMQTVTSGAGDILLAVSQTSDPNGSWLEYRFPIGFTIDFPIVGFNKNWISISINRYSNLGAFQRGINFVVDYGQARAGTGTGTLFTQAANSHFCSAPAVTYSATEDTLFVITHLSSTGGTYSVDLITGTPSVPVYTVGGTLTRPGGGWAQPTSPKSQVLPQSAPNSGTSSCIPTCVIETQDSQVRSAPVYRAGTMYYTQTIGLPLAAMAHTAVQWTKITTSGGFVDGGRIEDPTATASNGGKWYAFPHIAVSSLGDFIIGYSQFSSAQHPSAGYSMHLNADGAGTLRDPLIYKAGEDYYHKDFGSGRNRWGDFSQAQVDPTDDRTLWVVQEYAKNRVGTNDGTTGANSSRWSTWWASVAGPPTVTLAPGPSLPEGNSGLTPFPFTVNFSNPPSQPMTINYQTSDGTATVADNDYQAATGTLAVPPGAPSGTITINVVGDTKVEPNETFNLTLTGATNAIIGSPNTAPATIVNDDTYTITATANANGTITPSGAVSVTPGASQAFVIAPNPCYHVADVLVDGVSVGAVTGYTFTAVSANHTITASFALDSFVITASAGSGGTITPSGAVAVNCGSSQSFTIAPDASHTIADVMVDGASVGAVTGYTFANVTAAHTISASFAVSGFIIAASAGVGGTITPSGSVAVASGADQTFTIAPGACYHISDVLVDGSSVGPMASYTFTAVSASHTIAASFAPDGLLSIGDVTQYEGNSGITNFDFPVQLSGPCSQEVDVTWKTVEGTATVADNDYQPDSTTLALAPGATSGTITVHVIGDTKPESSETFFVDLLNPVNAGIARAEGTGTILNDDGTTAAEGTLPIREVSLDVRGNPSAGPVSFRLALPASTHVELTIFDIAGRRVGQALNTTMDRGYHSVTWDPRRDSRGLGSGVYFVRFRAQGKTLERRFVVLR